MVPFIQKRRWRSLNWRAKIALRGWTGADTIDLKVCSKLAMIWQAELRKRPTAQSIIEVDEIWKL